MDFREWGAEESGVRVAEQDDQKRQLFNLALQKAPYELDVLKSHADLYKSQAAEHAQKVAAAQQKQKLTEEWLARQAKGEAGGTGEQTNPLDQLTSKLVSMADLNLSVGDVDAARKIAGTISQVQSRQSQVDLRAAQQEAVQFKLLHDVNNYAANLARNARTPEQWAQAGELFSRMTGMEAPEVFSQPFSTQLRDQVVSSSMSAAQAATAEYQRRRAAAAESQAGTAAASYALRAELGRAELKLRQSREERLTKAQGSKALTAPNKQEQDAVRALVRQQYPKMKGDDLSVAATSIASEAKKLLKKNPGITTFEQAAAMAFQSQAQFFDTNGSTPTFRSVGRTPDRALPRPKYADQAKPGLFYKTKQGIRQYLGEGRFGDQVEVDDEPDDDEDE